MDVKASEKPAPIGLSFSLGIAVVVPTKIFIKPN